MEVSNHAFALAPYVGIDSLIGTNLDAVYGTLLEGESLSRGQPLPGDV